MTRRGFLAWLSIVPLAQTRFELRVTKTGVLAGKQHVFVFNKFHGEVATNVTFTVEANSIVNEDDWVSEKDRRKIVEYALHEMLEADKYREIRFVSEPLPENVPSSLTLGGSLTIRDRTRPVKVVLNKDGGDWWKGSAQLLLSDFGLKRPSAALGTIGTKDEMTVNFRLSSGAQSK